MRRLCRRRRRIDHRHGQDREPLLNASAGGVPRLRESAHRQRAGCAWSTAAAVCDSDDGRNRERDDGRGRIRSRAETREDRNLESSAQAHTRLSRSRAHADVAPRGDGISRPRCVVSRPRVVHGDSVYRSAASLEALVAADVSGQQSNQRRVVAASTAHGGDASGTGVRRWRRR